MSTGPSHPSLVLEATTSCGIPGDSSLVEERDEQFGQTKPLLCVSAITVVVLQSFHLVLFQETTGDLSHLTPAEELVALTLWRSMHFWEN